jgi:HK97 family phage major capsid protein
MTQHTHAPETKAASAPEVGTAFHDFLHTFETFKADNDERIRQIERRGSADVVTEDKVERINRALDAQQKALDGLLLKQARPERGGVGAPRNAFALQHKAAFESYIRRGEVGSLPALEAKALSVGSNPDGGYTVPPEIEASVTLAIRAISPIRSIAQVRQVSSATYQKPFSTTSFAAGWAAETAARPQTANTALASLTFPTFELYAMPAATTQLLDDSAVNIDQWIADEVRLTFAQQEGDAFINGDGITRPKGFLGYTAVPNASFTWGNIGYLATGVSAAFPASNPSDSLSDLIYTLSAGYRSNASFVLGRTTQGVVRKFKDTTGHYLWQPAGKPGEAPTLMGYPAVEAENMPDIAANSFSIAFGDFGRGYLVVDRVGISVLRDPFSSKPYVLFYTTKRVGGGVQDFNALKLLKFGVS